MNAYRHDKRTTRFPLKIDLLEHSCSPEMWLEIFFTNFTCAAEPTTVAELHPQEQTEAMKFN
jgi:hypothetical protein